VFKKLGDHKISFCSSNYSSAQLKNFNKQLKNNKGIKEGYIFFNNDINTYAVYNARELRQLVCDN